MLRIFLTLGVLLPAMACARDLTVPPGFLWGTATSAHQVEGGNDGNDWWDWELIPGHIKNGDRSGLACDHYNRFDTDLDLAQDIHSNAYRFSIEWARVEPADGQFDPVQIEHYRRVLLACRKRNIVAMATLFHFTLPRWTAAMGGFENPLVVDKFVRFTRKMATEFGDLVNFWCTLNEPVVYMAAGYLRGVFPPGKQDLDAGARVYVNLIKAHGRAYRAIHEVIPKASVGFAHHMRIFDPWFTYNPADMLMAGQLDGVFNGVFLRACTTGEAKIGILGRTLARVSDPILKGTMDYIGLNYYSRDRVSFNLFSPIKATIRVTPRAPLSDLGWEIYPEGMYRLLMTLKSYHLPVYITENGIADAADKKRSAFLRDHLGQMGKAMAAGADVRGYFHWSLMDNFEWAEGFAPRFGLYRVDYQTQNRTLTSAGRLFSEVATSGRLPKATTWTGDRE
jgi:beta-glucosidase